MAKNDMQDNKILSPDLPERHGEATIVNSSRIFSKAGHEIEIKATYQVFVDGVAVELHFSVGQDGKVSSHLLPYETFSSLVDMVARIVESFSEDFGANGGNDDA